MNLRALAIRWGACAVALGSVGGQADVPRTLSFQGRLPAYGDTTVALTVRFYDAANGGTELYSEVHNAVLKDGVFSLAIGAAGGGLPPAVLAAAPVWVGVSVAGGVELSPRTTLRSVPYSYKALGSERLIIPGTFDTAVQVEGDGHVLIDGRVELGAAGDGGGVALVRNAANADTVRIDGEETGGGRIELFNGATTNTATVVLRGNESNDGTLELFDTSGFQALRLHSDLTNNAPELSMFVGATNLPTRETVQIQANFDGGSAGAGELRLRRVDPVTQTAVTTVVLAATGDNLQDLPNDGGQLILSHSNGSPVFTVHAGDGASALSPAWMELRNANDDRHVRMTPMGLTFHDNQENATIVFGGSSGTATFNGQVTVGVLTITGGADLSERFDVAPNGAAAEPGMVVCIDPQNPGALRVSRRAYDATVAGVISGAGGIQPGMLMSQSGSVADGQHPVALTGRVWVWCDATADGISPGDLLTSSDTPGHAMKASDGQRRPGATIGKAMTALARGERGLVLTLVNLQ